MRRFGSASAGLSAARERAQGVARALSSSGDSSAQLAGLNQLCEMLNTGTEETLASLRPDAILPGVVQIMQTSMNPDLTILATRAMTYFVDAIPGSTNAVAGCGGVDAVAAFLLEIRDIELAEQALVCLDKIAQENPAILLQSRGPEAFLLFVDFFGIVIQRRASSAVANLARRAAPHNFHRFVPVLQQLRNMILHEDDRMAENALTALSRIVEGVQSDNTKIQAILEDAVPAFVEVLEGKHGALGAKILASGAQSPKIAATLVDSGIVTVVAKLLGGQLIRATPAPTPANQTPQLGATNQNNNVDAAVDALSPLQLGDSAASPTSNNNNNNNNAATEPQVRPEMALDLVTIVLRLLPEVHEKDFMLYLTEGCKFFDRATSNDSASNSGRGGSQRPEIQFPPGMPPELQETFRRMLEARHGAGAGAEEDEDDDDEHHLEYDEHDEEGMGDEDSWIDEDDSTEEEDVHELERTTSTTSTNDDSSNNNNKSLSELAAAASVTISPDARWARRVNGQHYCDTCSKGVLELSDWFRSNERDDFDLCRTCFMKALREHTASKPFAAQYGRKYTDMSHFATSARRRTSATGATGATTSNKQSKPSSASATSARPQSPLVRPTDPRKTLLQDSPYILPRVAEGMHAIVKYRMGSEDTALHARVLDLIHRVVAHLSGDEIRHFFWDIPLTTILTKTLSLDAGAPASSSGSTSAGTGDASGLGGLFGALARAAGVSDPSARNSASSGASSSAADHIVGQHVVSLAICQILLEKMNKTIVPYFFRNGLSRALTVRCASTSSTSSTGKELPIQQQLATGKSRREFVAKLAKQLNEQYFKDQKGSAAFDKFSEAAKLLIQYKYKKDDAKNAWKSAVQQLVTRFGGGSDEHNNNSNNNNNKQEDELPSVSAHEMDDSGMLEGLTAWLQACASLPTTSPAATEEALIEGVMQAVELVSSLFQISSSSSNNNNNEMSMISNSSFSSPTPPGSPSLSATNNQNTNNQNNNNNNTALHRFVAILQDIVADCDKFDPASVRIRRGRDSVELRLTKEGPAGSSTARTDELKVSIDRQASVGAIEDYLRTHVYGQPSARRRGEDSENTGDDAVEEILPNLKKNEDAAASTTTTTTSSSSSTATAASVATTPIYIRSGSSLLQSQLTMIDVINRFVGGLEQFESAKKPLHFHFSLEPFPESKVPSQASKSTSALQEDDDASSEQPANSSRKIYDDNTKHRIFIEFKKACTGKLHVDSASVSGSVARAMRLLRIIHVITNNLNSLRCFLRMQNYHKRQVTEHEDETKKQLLSHLFFAAGPLDIDDAVPGVRFSPHDFISRRLTAKCEKVLSQQSTLTSLRDSWCSALAMDCSFLLPLDTRVGILELGFLGHARGVVRHAERTGAADNNSNNRGAASPLSFMLNQARGGIPRVPRKKFRVWRDQDGILQCANEIFKRGPDGGTASMLEFEFYGEVGSGLGPTLEFYALTCEGLQKKARGLFRSDDYDNDEETGGEFCRSANGLFLALTGSEDDARTLGSLLSRCLMDRRVASLYMSSALVRLLRGEQLVFDDISSTLPVSNWHSLMDIYAAGKYNKGIMIGDSSKNRPDCSVADLSLSFELPFQPTDHKPVELKPNGSNIDVDENNCVEYAELVAKNILANNKIYKLAAEIRNPLISVLDSQALKLFEPHELASIWKGVDRVTTVAEFERYTTFDHGFTSSHPTAKMLLEVLSEMSSEDQHKFFRFLTGSPSLPVGGLGALRPKFTVVRRVGEDEQMQLPSAMTCQNYLKLPSYSDKQRLKDKLYQAMNEGAGSFMFT